jgi:predicted secreted protein
LAMVPHPMTATFMGCLLVGVLKYYAIFDKEIIYLIILLNKITGCSRALY